MPSSRQPAGAAPRRLWLLKETNRYRGTSVTTHDLKTTLIDGMKWFDEHHKCWDRKIMCDYCRADWKFETKTHAIRKVDHDGAPVDYEVEPIEVLP